MSDKIGPKVHELKCHPGPFAALKSGAKTFEWRKDDRGYQVGDTLVLKEGLFDSGMPLYTGQELTRTVTYVIREGFGIPEGYCIMGLRSLAPSGAVVEARPFPTDLHKVAREWTNKWCQTYSPHDQQAVAIALWELLEKQASNFASPSVEPPVEDAIWTTVDQRGDCYSLRRGKSASKG